MCTFDTTMKTCLCLLVLVVVVAYVKGEPCQSGFATDCRLTLCSGTDWTLSCIDNLCTCTHTGGGSHACRNNEDCGHQHNCERGQHWRCLQGTCHCTNNN